MSVLNMLIDTKGITVVKFECYGGWLGGGKCLSHSQCVEEEDYHSI